METVKNYTSYGFDENLTKTGSPILGYTQTDNIEFDQMYEGVPANNLLFDAIRIKKKRLDDPDNAGIWMGIDEDGLARFQIGDSINYLEWDGTDLALTGAIKIYDAGVLYGLLEVNVDGTDGQVRLVDPYNGEYGLYLSATIGSGSNTTAALIAQGAQIVAGGTGAVYQSQLIVDTDYFGAYHTGGGNYLLTNLEIASNWVPNATETYNLGSTTRRWNQLHIEDIVGVSSILPASSVSDVGSSTEPFDNIYCQDIMFAGASSNPTTNGQLRYYSNGGTEGLRMQLGGSDFQFDATGV